MTYLHFPHDLSEKKFEIIKFNQKKGNLTHIYVWLVFFPLSAENLVVINKILMVSVKKIPVLHLHRNNKTQQKSRPLQDKINMDAVSAVLIVFSG